MPIVIERTQTTINFVEIIIKERKKHLKNEQSNRDDAAKKELIQVE